MRLMGLNVVQRVHWLRARSQKSRWSEEFILVGYEMQWVVRHFLYQAKVWSERQTGPSVSAGAAAYASRQHARWTDIAAAADSKFKANNVNYILLLQ